MNNGKVVLVEIFGFITVINVSLKFSFFTKKKQKFEVSF